MIDDDDGNNTIIWTGVTPIPYPPTTAKNQHECYYGIKENETVSLDQVEVRRHSIVHRRASDIKRRLHVCSCCSCVGAGSSCACAWWRRRPTTSTAAAGTTTTTSSTPDQAGGDTAQLQGGIL